MEAAGTNAIFHSPHGSNSPPNTNPNSTTYNNFRTNPTTTTANTIRSGIHDYKITQPGEIGLLKSTIFPSIFLNTSLSTISYLTSRSLDRVEVKDWFWGGNQVANIWWTAIGRPVFCDSNLSVAHAFEQLSWTQKLLLSSVSLWGTRLSYRIATRGFRRHRTGKGNDDPRYSGVKKQPGFWKTAFWKLYLPEVAFQSVIALPFTVPFRSSGNVPPFVGGGTTGAGDNGNIQDILRVVGVGIFGVGFALEGLADWQLSKFKGKGLQRSGVWSIVRHPNYFGDILIHTSFALLSLADSFHPIVILGPLANYIFLRFYGGDKENEASQEERYQKHSELKYRELQEWKREKNSVWPSLREVANPWTWVVVGCGVGGVFLEEVVRAWCDAV